jgi:phage tail sheath protein FI
MTMGTVLGVNVREFDRSYYVPRSTATRGGMAIVTDRGPLRVPTLVTDWQQFYDLFGGEPDGYESGVRAAKRALDRGVPLYVSRVVHYTNHSTKVTTAAKATISVGEIGEPYVAGDTVRFTATSEGTWAHRALITIALGTKLPATEFKVTFELDGESEAFDNLSMDPDASNYVETAINGASKWFTVEDLDSTAVPPADRPMPGEYTPAGGNDGLASLAAGDWTGNSGSKTGIYAFEGVTDIRMLACPTPYESGSANETAARLASIITAGLAYAADRKDLEFITSIPPYLGGTEMTPQLARAFRMAESPYDDQAAFDSSYGSCYFPWVYGTDLNGNAVYLPPEGDAFAARSWTDYINFCWFAPAGLQDGRGKLLNATGVSYELSESEIVYLFEVGINAIRKDPKYGVVLWGDKTLQVASSAFDQIGVRRAFIEFACALRRSIQHFVFSPNDETTWRELEALVNPYFEAVVKDRGLDDFRFVCDATTNTAERINRGELHAIAYLLPKNSVRWLYIDLTAVPHGFNFDIGEANAPTA